MQKTSYSKLFLIVTLCLSLISSIYVPGTQAAVTGEVIFYSDQLGEGIIDHSWAEHSLEEKSIVHTGSRSISLNPSMDGALYLYSRQYLLTREYNTLEFWIHGGASGGQQLNVLFQLGGQTVAKVDLDDYLADESLKAGEWQKVQINLQPLRMPNDLFDGILLQDKSQSKQGVVYLDDIRLIMETEPVPNKPPKPVFEQIVVYDNALNSAFQGYLDPAHGVWDDTSVVHSAGNSIRINLDADNGLYIYKDRVLDTKEYITLEFWLNGGVGGQQLDLTFKAGGEDVLTVDLNDYLSEQAVQSGVWEKVSIPLETLAIPDDLIDGILFLGRGDQEQAQLYLDDMVFVRKTYEQPKLTRIGFAGDSLLMYAGNTETPKLTAFYDNGFTETVTQAVYWSSNAEQVVTVDNGSIQALAKGEGVISAVYENLTADLSIKAIEVIAENIFDDQLQNEYDDWSWAKRNLQQQAVVHSGTTAIEFLPRWWQGVYFNREESYSVDDYYGFEFWVHGGAAGKQSIRFVVQDMNTILGAVVLDDVLPQGIKANEWQKVTVRLKDMDITEGYFNALVFQAWDWKEQQPVYVDDVKVLRYKDRIESPKPPVTSVSVDIDAAQNRKAVNPDIYGVNYEEIAPQDVSKLDSYPVMRWGGNAVTRYNWQLNVQNHASDWFYMNLPKENKVNQTLPNGSRSDQFIDETLKNGAKVLLQVPTIGWTPKSRAVTTGFSVSKYGAQQQTECSYGGWWCNADAGNGIRPDGTFITNNDPHDTSKEVGPSFVADWIKHIQSRVGDQVNYYALDNEPMLWPYTHRDVHPEMTTYDEVWDYTEAYSKAIKEVDPDSNIFGPVVWGWCAYFYSAKDGCSSGPDSASHGNKPFLEWYLEQVEAYKQENTVRLVDYLDIHYYPMESGVAISEDESKAVSARRLKSLKSLYDPTFRDSSSWIWEPVNLIPRMKDIITRTAPGTKLAISEYNFGNGRGISSGLAQAEALAIFGREGVDLATRWGQPLANTPIEDAFKLYLNYDGKGGQISGDSVKAISSNVDMVGSYAIAGADGRLYILLFNKDTAPKEADVSIAGQTVQTGDVYRFDATNRLGLVESIAMTGSQTIELPARSATLIVAKP